MPEGLKKITEPFMAMSPARRWMIAGVVGLSVLAFALMIVFANKTDYRPLFTNLTSEDAGEIVKKLKEQKVPYRIASDGKAVLVPSDKVYDLRLSLASEGLPQGGGVGFEIFDRKNFGMTEFVQKLNYQRALQGELSRTIGQIAGVEQARVHLVIPEKSLFREQEKHPTASVVLKLKGNRPLRDNDVQGVVHLVASAIEGMSSEHVTILDNRGKVLSKGNPSDAAGKMTATMLETQRGYERNLEERIQTLLDAATGAGKSVARVSATFDFRQVEKFEEKYDPETVVRSEQRSEEKSENSAQAPGGVPGVQSNLARTQPAAGGSQGGGAKTDETLNYEVSRVTARIVEPVGTLKKVSVAILVDGKYEAPAAPAKGGAPAKAKYSPRSAEELQKIEALVKGSVGFSSDRGDQVTVVNIPFNEEVASGVEEKEKWWETPFFMAMLKNGLIALGFISLLLIVIRPLLNAVKTPPRTSFEPLGFGGDEAGMAPQGQLSGEDRLQLSMQAVSQMEMISKVKQEPYQTAQIMINWLKQKD